MSKVYHGSIEEVKSPEIRQPNRSLDYGSGFYTTTTTDERFAREQGEGI